MVISNWIVPFNEEDKLLNFSGLKDNTAGVKVSIEKIYLTNVAIAIHIKMKWENVQPNDNGYKDVKDGLAKLLRYIGGVAEQRGFLLPLIAAIEINNDDEIGKKIVERWAADQDWHRGDFSLFCLLNSAEVEKELEEWILGADKVYGELGTVQPLTVDVIKKKLVSEIQSRTLSEEYRSFLETIHDVLDKDKVIIENDISNWVNQRLMKIERIITSVGGEDSRGLAEK